MISIDRKARHDILEVTKNYDDDIFFHPNIDGFCIWTGAHPDRASVKPSISCSEVPGVLNRFKQSGLIDEVIGVDGHGMIFRITPELLHYKAFWWDKSGRPFILGFISGIAATVISGLILHFVVKLF